MQRSPGSREQLGLAGLAAWAMLLAQSTGHDDIVFGSTVAGRPSEMADVERMVGLFINTVAVRVRVLPEESLREFLVRHDIKGWRTTKHGRFGTKDRDFELLEAQRPEFRGLADVHKTVKQLHELQLFAGADGRDRTPLWPFSTITSRAAPNAPPPV